MASGGSKKGTRPLLPSTRVALELVADTKRRRFGRYEFEMQLFARGVGGPDARKVVDGLVRRGWAVADSLEVTINEDGWLKATTPRVVPVLKKKKAGRNNRKSRMPIGLF